MEKHCTSIGKYRTNSEQALESIERAAKHATNIEKHRTSIDTLCKIIEQALKNMVRSIAKKEKGSNSIEELLKSIEKAMRKQTSETNLKSIETHWKSKGQPWTNMQHVVKQHG